MVVKMVDENSDETSDMATENLLNLLVTIDESCQQPDYLALLKL